MDIKTNNAMNINVNVCILTGWELQPDEVSYFDGYVEYVTEKTGKVRISIPVLLATKSLWTSQVLPSFVVAGICKNRTLRNLEPILVTDLFLREGYKDENPPINSIDRMKSFLNTLLYLEDNTDFDGIIQTDLHNLLAYTDHIDFRKILTRLHDEDLISYSKAKLITSEVCFYRDLRLSVKARKLLDRTLFPDEKLATTINNLNIQKNIGSPIQFANSNSEQVISDSTVNYNDVRAFIEDLNSRLNEIKLEQTLQTEILAEIATINAQINSSKPKLGILKESLNCIKSILMGLTSNVATQYLLEQLQLIGILK